MSNIIHFVIGKEVGMPGKLFYLVVVKVAAIYLISWLFVTIFEKPALFIIINFSSFNIF